MTSERTRTPAHDIRRPDGRRVRFSWRFKAFQNFDTVSGVWRNITPEMARSYCDMGLPMGCHGGDAFINQGDGHE
jgi:hypothetical protein